MRDDDGPRFLTMADVADILNTSVAQVRALIHREELKAIRIGGRNQWRVDKSELEAFIERMYDQTREHLRRERGGSAPSDEGDTAQRQQVDPDLVD